VTTEVPDEVADVIEKYESAKPKPDPNAGINFGGAQSDWNQTDSSAADFIKNKTHYKTETVIMEEQELAFVADMGGCVGIVSAPIENGDTLLITFDGVDYECTVAFNSTAQMNVFGNLSFLGFGSNTGEPFAGLYASDVGVVFITADEANHTAKIAVVDLVKLSEKYLPDNFLYTDDTYLYRNQDTSDVSNRITKNELLEYVKRERVVRIYSEIIEPTINANEHSWYVASLVYIGNLFEYGYVCALETSTTNDSGGIIVNKYYTAEYTE
jgi:hypothetical protein